MVASYNGWPASRDPDAIGIVPFEPIPGHDFPGGVKGGDVHTIFTYLVRQLNARVEPIEFYPAGDEWGYFFKDSANSPSLLSCHSSGTAVDYNAVRHPNGRRGTWTAVQVREIRKILDELGGVVRWLYDATRTPDEMHFEIKGSAAEVAAVARRISNPPAPQEPFTMGQYEEIVKKLDGIAGAVLVNISENREEADDTPPNMPAMLKEIRVNQRTVIVGINELRKAAGLPPLKIVIGYNGSTPIYQS